VALYVLHFVPVILFSVFMLLFVDTKAVAIDGAQSGVSLPREIGPLQQNDIPTIISACLVVIRIFATSCSLLNIQRSTFIRWEKRGLSLSQISRLVYYHLPPVIDASRDLYCALVAIIVLINFPMYFSRPLAQGSVTWVSGHVPSRVSTTMPLSVAGPGLAWYDMGYPESRVQLRQRGSATAAALALPDDNYELPSSYTFSRRRSFALPDLQRLPVNSSLSSVTMPYLAISSLEWMD